MLVLPSELEDLRALALDLRWSWNHGADQLWTAIDAETWCRTGNAWLVLRNSAARLRELAGDADFLRRLAEQSFAHARYLDRPAWFSEQDARHDIGCIAYFSMEFGLSEALPIYAGGLGILAGDYCKAASDLGIPAVGVGLLYREGYFQQRFDADADQQEAYVDIDPDELPLEIARDTAGVPIIVSIGLPGRTLHLNVWEVRAGRTRLYLLDSDDDRNATADRGITRRLYAGDDAELRIEQEIVLGIGGIRALDALGLAPDIVHLNEGHAAFAVLERARLFAVRNDRPFEAALRCTRAGTVFTTHTAVAAAFDRFPRDLVRTYLGDYAENIGLSLERLLEIGGALHGGESLAMAALAQHGAGTVNAVSRLHAEVSRELFAPLFPGWPTHEIPVTSVTNGVHMPTWDSSVADAMWTEACGRERWTSSFDTVEKNIASLSDEAVWSMRRSQRALLTQRLGRFEPDVLVIGFARRFTEYKRAGLLLTDPERLVRLICHAERPVQLVIAGKAHPSDLEGKQTIHRWLAFMARPEVRDRALFVPDYDLAGAQTIIEGVDVWLNTPRRTWEACGTSGMKVLVNGGLDCSTLDGWWDEAYTPEVGWAIGDRRAPSSDSDEADAESLYRLLENEIVPEFYMRDGGIPRKWVARVRASMAHLTPRYSTNRMMKDYVELYRPAARAYRERTADRGRAGTQLETMLAELGRRWSGIVFRNVAITPQSGGFAAIVDLAIGEVDPKQIAVELYANPEHLDGGAERHALTAVDAARIAPVRRYEAVIATHRPAEHFTARVIPTIEGVSVPMEYQSILWQR